MVYTEAQKAEWVKLYLEVGPDEASKAVGCSRRQGYRWLGSHGVSPKKPDEQRAETEQRHTEKRQQIRELLLDQAIDALIRMKEPHYDYRGKDVVRVDFEEAPSGAFKDYATAAAILIDKYRLEMGEHTDRTQTVTIGLVESEIEKLEAQLAATGNH